jgi:hypothetical protein
VDRDVFGFVDKLTNRARSNRNAVLTANSRTGEGVNCMMDWHHNRDRKSCGKNRWDEISEGYCILVGLGGTREGEIPRHNSRLFPPGFHASPREQTAATSKEVVPGMDSFPASIENPRSPV